MYSLKVCKYSKLFHLQFEHDFEKMALSLDIMIQINVWYKKSFKPIHVHRLSYGS